jgi:hypothetical protein
VLHNTSLERFAKYKYSILSGPFISYEKMKCCEYDSRPSMSVNNPDEGNTYVLERGREIIMGMFHPENSLVVL